MTRFNLLSSAIGAAFMAAACAATPALALEAKQCLPMAQMNEALRTDGQRTMIIGNREALQTNDIKEFVNTVTSNADGSVGYQLEGDLPRAQASTSVCVATKLTNIRFYDARRPTIPAAAFLGGQFDAVVRENAGKGTRPMVIADTIHASADGQAHTGLPFVMFGNVEGRSASIATRLPDGKPQLLVMMADTDYTAAGLAKLNTQVAALDPK